MKIPSLLFFLASCLSLFAAETVDLTATAPETFWTATNSRVEAAQVDGQPVLRWHLEPGQQANLSLKPEHPLFSRLRYFDRLEFRFRIASGQAEFVDFRAMGHVSGARAFKIHQWQVAIQTTTVGPWYTRQLDLSRPNWFPWDDPDGNDPHFRFGAVGVAPDTVVELSDIRLISNPLIIKPFFEFPITWPIRSDEADGSVVYRMEIPVLNTVGRPTTIHGKIVSTHPHFEVTLEPASGEVQNGKIATFTVVARMKKAEIAATPLLYSEPVRVAFHTDAAPEVTSTFEMPVTRPLDPGYRKQVVIPEADIAFIRSHLNDETVRKALDIPRTLAEADRFLGIKLLHVPVGHATGRINYWPLVPGTKKPYEVGSFMPEIVNPVTGERETGSELSNRVWKEYLGQMGRVPELLGYAYLFTGDEKYAAKGVELLELWAKNYKELQWMSMLEPAWNNGPAILAAGRIAQGSSYGSNWVMRQTMRMLGMISESPSLTPEARKRIYEGFVLPYATEIAKFPGGISNMTDITNHNLLLMGLAFDDANLVHWALLTDSGVLFRLRDIDEDGFSSEGRPTNYHTAAMQEYLPSIAYLRQSGLKLDIPTERLLAAVKMPFQRATLWGVIPNSGDCGRGASVGPSPLADDLVAIFPDEKWLLDIGRGSTLASKIRRLATHYKPSAEGYQPLLESTSRLYSKAGLAVLRTGDTPETQIMATLDYGRNPMHGHLDRNQFTLAAFGKTFTHGTGTLYNAGKGGIIENNDPQLQSFCGAGSLGQNGVMVDAQNQQTAIGTLLAWNDKPAECFATARVPAIAPGVDHTRTVLLRNGLVVLIDDLDSQASHQYDFVYHNFGVLTPGAGWTATPQKEPLATSANYENIRDLQRLSGQGPVHLLWDLSNQVNPNPNPKAKAKPPGGPVHLGLWQLSSVPGEVYTGVTGMNNPNTTRVPDEAPSLFHRVEGRQARFVTVLEPYREQATVTGIGIKGSILTIHRGGQSETVALEGYHGKN